MHIGKKIVATSVAALIGSFAVAGAASAAPAAHPAQDHRRTVEAPRSTEHVPARKAADGAAGASQSRYARTVEVPAGTEHVKGGEASRARTVTQPAGTPHIPARPAAG
ncbi:hypothetical protein ACGFXC_27155 [Streptomyces sp. NPDC048507]|uniref:hypothetical protein n=1 Tax=Streptomyces sp. NPDC048507 TaxID=3365560 RepID=UPI00371A7CA2